MTELTLNEEAFQVQYLPLEAIAHNNDFVIITLNYDIGHVSTNIIDTMQEKFKETALGRALIMNNIQYQLVINDRRGPTLPTVDISVHSEKQKEYPEFDSAKFGDIE